MSVEKAVHEAPFAGTVRSPISENDKMVTGNWRMIRPVVDTEKCTQCLTCWLSCPDSCITPTEDFVEHNYKYCKGCGICIRVCTVGAVVGVPELEFEDNPTGKEA
ncbi:MAG TPA: 4Fe-4S binding protein [Firmicutes bacterium]|nr:4Fe-4S binding protein [Bacillota bacterium]